MPIFYYTAYDKNGKEAKGKIDATSAQNAMALLQSKGLYPLQVQGAKAGRSESGASSGVSLSKLFSRKKRVSPKLITDFSRQFAVMIDTGIPYNRALEILISEEKNETFQGILSEIRASVIEGNSLAEAMAQHPHIFSSMFVAVIQAGEASGKLSQTLLRQTSYEEQQQTLKSKAQTAMIYPLILSLLAVAIMVFMLQFILPRILPIFSSFDVDLPLPTRMVIGANQILSDYSGIIFLSLGLLLFGIQRALSTKKGLRFFHQLALTTPVYKEFTRKILNFRLVQSLGNLLSSGVELSQSLDIVYKVITNTIYREALDAIRDDVTKKGLFLSQAIKKTGLIDEAVVQMIRVGEESGQLEPMMMKISEHLEKDVRSQLEKSLALLEPLIILFMSLGIGFIILAVILPIFEMNQLVR